MILNACSWRSKQVRSTVEGLINAAGIVFVLLFGWPLMMLAISGVAYVLGLG